MFIPNPTEPMLVNIRAQQQDTLAKLNALSSWSDEEFDQVFLCHHNWYPQVDGWAITDEDVALLKADPRTPKGKLDRLEAASRKKLLHQLTNGRDN